MIQKNWLMIVSSILLIIFLVGCSDTEAKEKNQNDKVENNTSENNKEDVLTGKMTLDNAEGKIGDTIEISAESLEANTDLTVVYMDKKGQYDIKDDKYSFDGILYETDEVEVATGTADDNGEWTGEMTIPDGFGDDHDVIIFQEDKKVAKANLFVETYFEMKPESGPIGTEIEVTGKGLSPKMYGSIWHLNYDNAYTGMITGVSTKGSAKAVIRATGNVGKHMVTIESGASGSPFLSRDTSAINYISTQYFEFEVTDDQPVDDVDGYVEEAPEPAGEGIELDPLENKDGVDISLDKDAEIVGEEVVLTGSGLPKNETVDFDWHTMVGNRVTPEGFSPELYDLGQAKTDKDGNLEFKFPVPDDLGGLEHLIDVRVGDDVYGQTYLRILPSIVSISPKEGPPGTQVMVEINGSGWTEFDNALAFLYDNKYNGYICGFNSQGTVKLPFVASGEPGYHAIDIYPSIYKGSTALPDIYLLPQLTYQDDHPGTGMPAIRAYFKVTE